MFDRHFSVWHRYGIVKICTMYNSPDVDVQNALIFSIYICMYVYRKFNLTLRIEFSYPSCIINLLLTLLSFLIVPLLSNIYSNRLYHRRYNTMNNNKWYRSEKSAFCEFYYESTYTCGICWNVPYLKVNKSFFISLNSHKV